MSCNASYVNGFSVSCEDENVAKKSISFLCSLAKHSMEGRRIEYLRNKYPSHLPPLISHGNSRASSGEVTGIMWVSWRVFVPQHCWKAAEERPWLWARWQPPY
ncbi:unnamed protein product [Citrullus colocynthis]|uniref:Uncharacterized protein n=1 Tax=Citrullus colocynthis TaxID=252529 RepID=A0ABP0Z873_9ROSI